MKTLLDWTLTEISGIFPVGILALLESMTLPFRVLDEFDVFMDSVNRRIAIQNILNFARIGRKYQFVFLTPLGTDNIDTNDDVKIIKLSKIQN